MSKAAHDKQASLIAEELAKKTGVSADQVGKVLNALGVSAVLQNVADIDAALPQKLTAGNAKLAFRIGKSSVAV